MESYDYIIIGSGFGGSVSAMRLAQKGYKVAVIEAGKRWHAEDFPKTNMSLRKYWWLPLLRSYGIQRLDWLRHVMVLSGAGVGGGSLVYANTHYIPQDNFFEKTPIIKTLGGKKALLPFYQIAQKMLGVTQNPHLQASDHLLRTLASDMGQAHTFTPVPAAVYFGESNKTSADPYFMGEGPERSGCNQCGGCMVGCRFNAKNTLDKNYLFFAEKLGATVIAEMQVKDIEPLSKDGSAGYVITAQSSIHWLTKKTLRLKAHNIIISAGVLGSLKLLHKMQHTGRLPHISPCLGKHSRTNSEAIVGVTSKNKSVNFSQGIAITSSVYPDAETHIEPVRYSEGSNFMAFLTTLLTDGGGRLPRCLHFLGQVACHPKAFLSSLNPKGFARRTLFLLAMQSTDNSFHLAYKRRWFWPFKKMLSSECGQKHPIPSYIPAAHHFARRLAKKINGTPKSSIFEVLFNTPTTAHILGGACIAESAEQGVIDTQNRLFAYPNIRVCDGSMIPGNLGVNPSLSITALTERAMSFIPPKEGCKMHFYDFEQAWKIDATLAGKHSTVRQATGHL